MRIAPLLMRTGGGYGHVPWRPSGPGPAGDLAVTLCAVTDTADLVDVTLNGQPYHPLAVRYPTRVYDELKIATRNLFLDTRQPPLKSVRTRQAVNHAIDRSRIVQLLHGGHSPETVTCQILPTRAGSKRYHLAAAGERPTCPA
jgi:ABC-type transport system substrate-binding protein